MMTRSGQPLPFLLHFGERMPERKMVTHRYDARRSMGQVFAGGEWVDAIDVQQADMTGSTRLTDVKRETTDDD